MFWGPYWNAIFSHKAFWYLPWGHLFGKDIWKRTQALHGGWVRWFLRSLSIIFIFLSSATWIKAEAWILLFWWSKCFPPLGLPTISSLLPPQVPALFVHSGKVPCCFNQKDSQTVDFYWSRQDVFQHCSEKNCVSLLAWHTLTKQFLITVIALSSIFFKHFVPLLQPLSCLSDFFRYISSSLDLKFVEGSDLLSLIILFPIVPMGAQSMSGNLSWQWMKKEILKVFLFFFLLQGRRYIMEGSLTPTHLLWHQPFWSFPLWLGNNQCPNVSGL